MHSRESDIPAPVLTGILAAGYCGILGAGMILERLGVPAGIIQWFVIAGAMAPFLLLGLVPGTMQPGVFIGGPPQGGLLHDASGMAGAALTGGLMFLASWLAVSDTTSGLALAGGLAAGIALHGLLPQARPDGGPDRSLAWRLSHATGNRTVRLVVAGLLALMAFGLLLAQVQVLRMLLGTLFPAIAPAHWLAVAGIALAGAWTGGFNSASRGLPFSFAILLVGVAAPLGVLVHAAGDLTWAELFTGAPEAGVFPGDLSARPLAVSVWEWGMEPAAGAAQDLTLFASMALAGLVFVLLLPEPAGPSRRARHRTVPPLAALLLLLALAALAFNARVAGLIASGSLTDIRAGLIGSEAGWLFRDGLASLSGLVDVCGVPATSPATVQAACGAADHVLRPEDIRLNPVTAFLLPAAAFGMPAAMWPAALLAVTLAAAGTAAAMLAAIGRLIAEGAAVHTAGRTPRPASRRLAMARAGMLAAGAGAAWLGGNDAVDPFANAIFPGSLTIAALAVPLLAMRWAKVLRAGAVMAGMIAGAIVPALVLAARAVLAFPGILVSDTTTIERIATTSIPAAILTGAGLNLAILAITTLSTRAGTGPHKGEMRHERG